MSYRVRFTEEAEADLIRLYDFILDRDAADWAVADRALQAIKAGIRTLELTPFTCRKADGGSPFLRELVISFGVAGYVALFEIDNAETITVLALRHQRESDYH
ncbi:MAG: type II toxin-antitoxin system RelE/ParE family toxin [Rhodocyclaceae bacterium]|nr:type II toxin-antitoxin system RelE/ParE family toxin [Rhodocyclaceae bacterium]